MAVNETRQAHDDLAFMKALVDEGSRAQMTGGAAFLAAGLLFAFQTLMQWAHFVGLIHLSGPAMLALVVAVPVVFLIVLGILIRRDRRVRQGSVSARAWQAAFGGLGLGNLVLCGVFALLAWSHGNPEVWFLYGVAVCVMLGAAWYVAAMVRRRWWLWLVSAGWYATGIGLGAVSSEESLGAYFLILSLALILLLALPGATMMRSAAKAVLRAESAIGGGVQQAHTDLDFMTALVDEGSRTQRSAGAALLAGGLLYGLQCMVQWAQIVGLVRLRERTMIIFVILISVAFMSVLGALIWRERGTGQRAVGTRAWNAAFAGGGIGNLVLCTVFGILSWRQGSADVWLLYSVAVCVMLGVAWYVAAMMRKRLWLWLVAAGWYATALGLGGLLSIGDLSSYVLLIGIALVLLLALPGAAMMRQARTAG